MNSTQLVTRSTTIALFADTVPAILSGNIGDLPKVFVSAFTGYSIRSVGREYEHQYIGDYCRMYQIHGEK